MEWVLNKERTEMKVHREKEKSTTPQKSLELLSSKVFVTVFFLPLNLIHDTKIFKFSISLT